MPAKSGCGLFEHPCAKNAQFSMQTKKLAAPSEGNAHNSEALNGPQFLDHALQCVPFLLCVALDLFWEVELLRQLQDGLSRLLSFSIAISIT